MNKKYKLIVCSLVMSIACQFFNIGVSSYGNTKRAIVPVTPLPSALTSVDLSDITGMTLDQYIEYLTSNKHFYFGTISFLSNEEVVLYENHPLEKYWNTNDPTIDLEKYKNEMFMCEKKLDIPIDTVFSELVKPGEGVSLGQTYTVSSTLTTKQIYQKAKTHAESTEDSLGFKLSPEVDIGAVKKAADVKIKGEVSGSQKNVVSDTTYESFTSELDVSKTYTRTIEYKNDDKINESEENLYYQINLRQTYDVYFFEHFSYDITQKTEIDRYCLWWHEYKYSYVSQLKYEGSSVLFVPNGDPYYSKDRYYRNHYNGELALYDNYYHNKVVYF